jgi:Tfp pilus assembly protein PilE
MKEKIKNTKGITLVALIITIIVLLILAIVAITSINNNKILEYAKNGREAYNQGETNETKTINGYEKYLDENTPNKNGGSMEYPFIGNIYPHSMNDEQGDFQALVIRKNNFNYSLLLYSGTYNKTLNEYIINALEYIGDCKIVEKSVVKDKLDIQDDIDDYGVEVNDGNDIWYGYFLDNYQIANFNEKLNITNDTTIKEAIELADKSASN